MPKNSRFSLVAVTAILQLLIVTHPDRTAAQSLFLNWEQLSYPYDGDVNSILHDHHNRLYVETDAGIYHSTDDGLTWQPAGTSETPDTANFALAGLAIDPNDGLWYSENDSLVDQSSFHGDSWYQYYQDSVPPSVGGFFVWQNPYAPTGMALKIRRYDATARSWVPIFSDSAMNAKLSDLVTSFDTDGMGGALVGTRNFGGAYLSHDNGRNWQLIHSLPTGQSGSQYSVAFENPSTIDLAAGSWFYRSSDLGLTWDSSLINTAQIYSLCVARNGVTYVGGHGIVFRSTDQGKSWASVVETGSEVYQIAQNTNGTMFALGGSGFSRRGSDHVGIFRSVDGVNWEFANAGLSTSKILDICTRSDGAVHCALKDDIYLAYELNIDPYHVQTVVGNTLSELHADAHGHVYDNQGLVPTSTDVTPLPNLPDGTSAIEVTTRADGRFVATSKGIVYLFDAGIQMWDSIAYLNAKDSYRLFADPAGVLFVSTGSASLLRSADGGYSWTEIPTPYSRWSCVGTTSVGELYMKYSEVNGSYLYRSNDRGQTWQSLSLAVIDNPANSLVKTKAGVLYALVPGDNQWGGNELSRSTDGGSSWEAVPMQWNPTCLALDSSGYLYVGTATNGLVRAKLDDAAHVQTTNASAFSLLDNYPNPFDWETNVRFLLPHEGAASLSIVNALGKEVRSLTYSRLSSGIHTISLDFRNLPAGTYYYRLSSATFIANGAMTVIR